MESLDYREANSAHGCAAEVGGRARRCEADEYTTEKRTCSSSGQTGVPTGRHSDDRSSDRQLKLTMYGDLKQPFYYRPAEAPAFCRLSPFDLQQVLAAERAED